MKNRCRYPSSPSYKNYGGRGIVVCAEWECNYIAFYNWATANGYREGLQIDRIDNDGNYEPSNCRWVTRKEQCNNKRNNHFIAINGVTKTMAQWVDDTGISQGTIEQRVNQYNNVGESVIRHPRKITKRVVTVNGVTKTLVEWAKITGIRYDTLLYRITKYKLKGEDIIRPVRRRDSV